jgi:hypothetical protein
LEDKYLSSTELGKMKLEFILSEGIFIAPKFYGIKGENSKGETNKTIIKSKGIKKDKVNYLDLENIYKGEDFVTNTTVFRKNLAKGTVIIKEQNFSIKGKGIIEG